MDMAFDNITVQIMAGGKSSRMGRDKALVTLGGKTLLQRAIDTWSDWAGTLFLSVGGEERENLALVAGVMPIFDRYPGCGPLGGLHGGLAMCKTDFLLLCAVDSPFLTPKLAEGLVNAIGDADACVYTLDGRAQPLFGLYRTTCLSMAQTLLMQGDLRMMELLTMANTVTVPALDSAPFRNLNTPEELQNAEREYSAGIENGI